MATKRTNFKAMNSQEFIAYLQDKNIEFTQLNTTTVLGKSVLLITPNHFRLIPRIFESNTLKQLDSDTQLTMINMQKNNQHNISQKGQLIQLIDDRIQNMGVKGVYHPKRLKPNWNKLTDDDKKLSLFEKYITNKDSSIGFLKLVQVNLCQKTLEAVVIHNSEVLQFLKNKQAKQICIDKFSKYPNGVQYLKSQGIYINED